MAITLVQAVQNPSAGFSNSITISATGTGNLILCLGILPRGSTQAVSDNAGNTYTEITGAQADSPSLGYKIHIFQCLPSLAGATVVTAAPSTSGITVFEFSGVTAIDDAQHVNETSGNSAGPILTPAHANELFVCWIQNLFNPNNANYGAGWTTVNTQSYTYGVPAYLIASGGSTSTQQAIETPANNDTYFSGGASFSPSAGPSGAQKGGAFLVFA